jgi:hypothetical protein
MYHARSLRVARPIYLNESSPQGQNRRPKRGARMTARTVLLESASGLRSLHNIFLCSPRVEELSTSRIDPDHEMVVALVVRCTGP